jgi:hypothetical protein
MIPENKEFEISVATWFFFVSAFMITSASFGIGIFALNKRDNVSVFVVKPPTSANKKIKK